MHITCEHCGSTIDIDKDKICPNCGAPYNNNKEYKEVKDYHKKDNEMNLKEREMRLQNQETAKKVVKGVFAGQAVGFAIFAIIFIAAFIMIGYSIFKSQREFDAANDTIEKMIENGNAIDDEEEPTQKEAVTVSFNEVAQTDEFDIKCDKITNYNYKNSPSETNAFSKSDFIIYNFEIVFTSKVDKESNLEDIKLTYTDNDGNENILAKRHDMVFNGEERAKELDDVVNDTLTHKGNVAFELPKSTNNVKIIYDNVTIKIDNFKSKITK